MQKRGFIVVLLFIFVSSVYANECDNWQMQHPDWLWCDDFEHSSTSDYDGGWRDYITYVDEQSSPENVFSGSRAIQATITPGVNSAAGIYKFFSGQDTGVFARWYAKFDHDYDDQGHEHFVTLQGLDTSKPCGCSGCCANTRPLGDDRFLTGLEFDDKGDHLESRLYSYFYNQRNPSSGYRCCPKPLSRWAQDYRPEIPVSVEKSSWHSMELEIYPNTPGSDDGYVAYWIDGVLAMNVTHSRDACGPYTSSYTTECENDDPNVDVYKDIYDNPPPYPGVYPAEGFIWRTSSSLKLNNIWIQVFNHKATTNPGINKVWFDSLVVGKDYIGPAKCTENERIHGACYCGGKPLPDDSSNIYSEGYCCNGKWQGSECSITEYYVDPDYSGSSRDGSQTRPWNRLDSSAWSTINAGLADDDVIVYVSARDAGSDTGDDYGGGITVKRTDTSLHRLTLDGMSKYNTDDANPVWTDNNGNSKTKLVDAGGYALGWNRDDEKIDYITLRGFDITSTGNGITFNGNGIEIIGNNLHQIYRYGITGSGTDITVSNNKIHQVQLAVSIDGFNVLFENNEITKLYDYGTLGDSDYTRFFGRDIIVRNNFFHDTIKAETGKAHVDCIQTFDVNGDYLNNLLFYNNTCYDFDQGFMGEAMSYHQSGNITFDHNIFAHGNAWGIDSIDIAGVKVTHNTFYDIYWYGVGLRNIYSTGGIIKNNIFYGGPDGGMNARSYMISDGAAGTADYNMIYNAEDPDPVGNHDIIGTDPLFTDAAGYDFRPLNSSLACGNGENDADIGALPCSSADSSAQHYNCGSIDSDSSGKIENDELLVYIQAWYSGSSITAAELLDAIRLWKQGC